MSGPTLASLGIKIENGDVVKATTSLDGMTMAGTKAEASAQRLTRRMGLLEIEARNVDASFGQMSREMALAEIEARKMDAAMSKSSKSILSMGNAFVEAMKGVAALAVLHKFVEETEQSQSAIAQLEAAVLSTGGAAGRTVEQLEDLSHALQETSTYSHVAVAGAEAILLTFDKIRGAQFDKATQAVTDLATRMGGDLQGAAIKVGKAMQDPTTGLTALRKAGVSFSEAQSEVIKHLFETGHVAEGQGVILKALEAKYGGSAAAARNTLGGALAYLKNQFGDVFEASQESTSGITAAINAMGEAMPAVRGTINAFFGGIALIASEAALDVERLKQAWVDSPWNTAKGVIGGALSAATHGAVGSGMAASSAIQTAGSSNDTIRFLEKQRDLLVANLAGQTKATGATLANKAAVNELTKEQIEFNKSLAVMGVEVDKQIALNAAYKDGKAAQEVLSLAYDRRIALMKNALGHTADETARLNVLTNKKYDDLVATQKRTEAEKAWEAQIHRVVQASDVAFAKAQDAIEQHKANDAAVIASAVVMQEAIKARFDAATKAQREAVDQAKQYSDEMNKIWLHGINDMLSHGLDSWSRFFDSVLQLFTRLTETMEKQEKGSGTLAGLGATAVGGGIVGYQVGSAATSGNRGSAALFGAAAGAASGAAAGSVVPGIGTAIGAAVGAVAGFVGGIIGAGHAADLSAHEMENLRKSLETSIADVRAQLSGDALGSALAQLHAQFDALRKAAEDAYAYGANEADRNAKLAELNDLEAKRAQQIKDEAALLQIQAQEDSKVRTLVAQGHIQEADALAFAEKQAREYAEAVKQSADATTLAALTEAQAAEAKRRTADLAMAEQRAQEDASLRLAQALGDPGYEAAARAAQERREIEDLVAKAASEATIQLTKQAQAAEDLAKASADAAAAQQKQIDQQRQLEDLNVQILRAQGNGTGADDLAFQLDQQRRLEDAVKNNTPEYVDRLKQLEQLERDSRAAQQLIDSTTGGSGGGGGASAGATSAASSFYASITSREGLALVDQQRAGNSILTQIEVNTRGGSGRSGGGTVKIEIHIHRQISEQDAIEIGDQIADVVSEKLGVNVGKASLFAGSVGR